MNPVAKFENLDQGNWTRASIIPCKSLTQQKITYLALAAIGFGLSVAVCVACPHLAMVLAAAAAGFAIYRTCLYFKNNPDELSQISKTIKYCAFKVFGVFSKKYKHKASILKLEIDAKTPQMSTAKKVALVVLWLAYITLFVTSLIFAPSIAHVLSSVSYGLSFAETIEYLFKKNAA